jgi:hypothetical protein
LRLEQEAFLGAIRGGTRGKGRTEGRDRHYPSDRGVLPCHCSRYVSRERRSERESNEGRGPSYS